jgi:cell division protein FtsW
MSLDAFICILGIFGLISIFAFISSLAILWRSWEARLLCWLTLLWLSIGLVVLFSASYPQYGLKHINLQLWVGNVGLLIGFLGIAYYPLRHLLARAKWFVVVLLGLIFLTLVPGLGTTNYGATRWLTLGSFSLQPSELIKPFLVLQGAIVFGQWQRLGWKTRLGWLFIFACVLAGILLQPNLSTTALCGITLWFIALAAGLPLSYLGGTALSGIVLATISISIKDYQRRRVLSFINPWADSLGDGYQLSQSLLAVGSGGTWGAGYGLSQQKLLYLPFEHNDFIFAVFAEEFGFIGCLALLLLLITYATLGWIVANKTQNLVYKLVAIGATILLVGQSLLNIGVVTGLLPTTGLPLPLFSYGGNSLIASLVVAGLLIRVALEQSETKVIPLEERRPPKRSQNRKLRVVQKPQIYHLPR